MIVSPVGADVTDRTLRAGKVLVRLSGVGTEVADRTLNAGESLRDFVMNGDRSGRQLKDSVIFS